MPHPWRVSRGTKVSCYSGFSFSAVRETHESIDKWKDAWRCGLVVSIASGLLAVDIDDKAKFRSWVGHEGIPIPDTAWASTGGGGTHLLFDASSLAPEDWPTQGSIPGGDIKSNGFIAVEPSLHPNGQPYEWHTRELSPIGRLAADLSRYQAARIAEHAESSSSPEELRAACIAAGDGEQRAALRDYVLDLQFRGYTADDIVRLCVSLRLRNYDPKRPWRESDFRGLVKRGEVYAPTAEDIAILAGLPSLSQLRERTGHARPGGRWHDFGALVSGEVARAAPTVCARSDGVSLFYLGGKEHNIYGETETGKDMLLDFAIIDCLDRPEDNRYSVMEIDFEEGDQVDVGSRLLNMGLDPDLLTDPAWFRYATPATPKEADACLRDMLRWRPDLAIFNGVSAAYSLNGWPLKENDSWGEFRSHYTSPCLHAAISTISTDHVPKESGSGSGSGGRYAIGGVNKLNLATGTGYLLEAVAAIVRGGEGRSRIILTKDRPGGVKPFCVPGKSPLMRYAGTLSVKSVGDGPGELRVEITAPQPRESDARGDVAELPGWLLERVSRAFEDAGASGRSKTAVRNQWEGDGKKLVFAAVEQLESGERPYLVPGEKSTSGSKLVSRRPWRHGVDDKLGPNVTGSEEVTGE